MSFGYILKTLFLSPLKLILELIFSWANKLTQHPGYAVVILSILVNLLILPLYKRADKLQVQTRNTEKHLSKGISHIKNSFDGDERLMILQTYYRQNHYSPFHALKGSVSLLLQIPFFMAAYQFLSSLDLFDIVSFGPISNLGMPDGLLTLGTHSINLLPLVMTLINIASGMIYAKDSSRKEKIQLYILALVFLVLLYNSPACLVLYWTLNNIFSFVKNIIIKLKPAPILLGTLSSLISLALSGYGFYMQQQSTSQIFPTIFIFGIILQLPLINLLFKHLKQKVSKPVTHIEQQANPFQFLCGMLFATLLIGLLIPSTYIAASPLEYVDPTYFHHPLWFLVSSFCLAAGFFLIWMHIFYHLSSTKVKIIFENLIWILCCVMLINYMFFGKDLGILSPTLRYEEELYFTPQETLLNLEIILIGAPILYYIVANRKKLTTPALLLSALAFLCMSTLNTVKIQQSIRSYDFSQTSSADESIHFSLNPNGKNVIVFMLDRAVSGYVPYIFNEKPELVQQFDGFTYYSNTISHGRFTNFGSPGLLGGYEYTPVEMNKRDTEPLVQKHNEALLVMPLLFAGNDYQVTICDPPYANYQSIPDLSIYDPYPEINAYITQGKFETDSQKQSTITNNHRNFVLFSMMKTMPLCWQYSFYDYGYYHKVHNNADTSYNWQIPSSESVAQGIKDSFMENYNTLINLPSMTNISDNDTNTFLFFSTRLTHEPIILQAPDYIPIQYVNNTQYDVENSDRFLLNGRQLHIDTYYHMSHYHTNIAALKQLGNWFDYLRENGVYDNTRIILVSDHARELNGLDELLLTDPLGNVQDMLAYYPLLMVKDFNSTGFTTSTEFMTNADVPTLATQNLIENPVNPFTGNPINHAEKTAHAQYITLSDAWDVSSNNSNIFRASQWASIKDNIWDASNWTFSEDEIVLKEHSFP